MRLLYDLVYLVALLAAGPWLLWSAVVRGKQRGGWRQKLTGRVPRRTSALPALWLHGVSVGEVNLLLALLPQLQQAFPGWEIVLTSTTTAGYELARQRGGACRVCYFPFDFSWAVRAALRRLRPAALILAELEVWPNLLAAAAAAGVPVAVVNGRLSERSFRGYARVRWLLGRTFARLALAAAQTEEYAERFRRLGVPAERVVTTGSLKFDGALTDRDNSETQRLRALAGLGPRERVWLAGSTQVEEETAALRVFAQLAPRHPALRLIVVPRHPERFAEVAAAVAAAGWPWQLRSQLDPARPSGDWRVLVVDAVGELRAWWGTSEIAFVGGTLGSRGGQNMVEPAGFGAAVCFGPNTWNFRQIVQDLCAAEAAVVVHDERELAAFVQRCLADQAWAATLGSRARQFVLQQQGATRRTLAALQQMLHLAPPEAAREAA